MFGEDLFFTAIIGAFLLAGAGLMLAGVIQFFKTSYFFRHSITTSGTVTTLVVRRPTSPTIMTRTKTKGGLRTTHKLTPKAPQIRFTTAEGEAITFDHHIASAPPTYQIGQEVTVRYQSSRPHEAQINSFSSLWLAPLLFFFVGSLLMLFLVFFVTATSG